MTQRSIPKPAQGWGREDLAPRNTEMAKEVVNDRTQIRH